MKKFRLIIAAIAFLIVGLPNKAFAQFGDIPVKFGEVKRSDLDVKYDYDTSAAAVVIQEFGASWVDNTGENNLIHRYYTKIKILKKTGLEYANVTIMLRKNASRSDRLDELKAASYNIENGVIKKAEVLSRSVYDEKYNEYWEAKKFAIPNVRVGTVIEYEYTVETPFFVMNFKPWEFQADIPKMSSEYWATIPANYQYNIALRGFLKLSKNDASRLTDCFTPGANKADCSFHKWGMKNIPAFVEEDYMTARKNFVSAITFELMEIIHFDGRKDRVTKEWKDAEQELRQRNDFWAQIKKGKEMLSVLESNTTLAQDPLAKAKQIFEFVRSHYRWNEEDGIFSESGVKKAFDKREGNVADINLTLTAVLRAADLSADPVILATRDEGFPTELFPVLSEFNYVMTKVTIGDRYFLLDATNDFLPFGIVPRRCLNGKGRVIYDKGSDWVEIKVQERSKVFVLGKLKFEEGVLKGTLETSYSGYRAADRRQQITSFSSIKSFIEDYSKRLQNIEITAHEIKNLEDNSLPLIEKLEIELEGGHLGEPIISVNPFLIERWKKNPFNSSERLFPIDFGVPIEEITIISIELPTDYSAVDLPERVGVSLPTAGGRFAYDVQATGNKVQFNSSMIISKSIYPAEEYFHLKEFFSRVVQAQGNDIILKKNN